MRPVLWTPRLTPFLFVHCFRFANCFDLWFCVCGKLENSKVLIFDHVTRCHRLRIFRIITINNNAYRAILAPQQHVFSLVAQDQPVWTEKRLIHKMKVSILINFVLWCCKCIENERKIPYCYGNTTQKRESVATTTRIDSWIRCLSSKLNLTAVDQFLQKWRPS